MKNILLAAAILSLTVSTPSMAAVYSSAILGNYKFELVDLNTGDDLAPSIVFNEPKQIIISGTAVNGSGKLQGFNETSNTNLLSMGFGSGNEQVSAFSSFERLFSGAYGLTTGVYPNGSPGNFFGFSNVELPFTLSPFTQLNVLVESDIERKITVAGEFAQSVSQVSIKGKFVSATHNPQPLTGTYDLTEEMILSIFFDNNSVNAFDGVLVSYSQASGISFATPSAVPVPAALPLMASALGLFGFGAMRRKASKA